MHRILFVLFSLLLSTLAAAQTTFEESAVPAALKDWRGWVLKDLEFRACPFLVTQTPGARSAHVCAWPARLDISADAGGASFSQRWRVEVSDWIPLPGDSEHWPQEVSVDGKAAIVLARDGNPAVWLTPGSVEIRGRIPWAQRPQQLRVPAEVGLVALRVDGKGVEPLERSDEELTLGRGEAAEPEADALSLRVFRHLADGIPGVLTTQILFDVAGQAREETLAPVLPEGFIPVALTGELPAKLDPDGKLHAQVQPGSWTLTLTARATAPLSKLAARVGAEPWPQQEIWSYASAPSLRVTSATSATPIDPAQAGVPAEWRTLPAFALGNGDALTVEERSRGLNEDEANRLSLSREAWLDFSGASLYAKDRIGGRMQRGWRLDAAAPYKLERAEADGQGLLVTRGANASDSGVELRNPQVNLGAGLRISQGGGSLPITGWKQAFDNVSLVLHLPYGYRLLGAPGADVASGSWMSLWNLMAVFIVAVATLLAWRLLGFVGGALTLSYLVLSYHEPDAPLWTLLLTLALALLMKALPVGRLQTIAKWLGRVALVVLAVWSLSFLADQVRYALYPQLEPGAYASYGYPQGMVAGNAMNAPVQTMEEMPQQAADMAVAPMAEPPPPAPPAPAAPPAPMPTAKPMVREATRAKSPLGGEAGKLETIIATGGNSNVNQRSLITNRYAKNATIQAGRGEPGWQFGNSYSLSWSGPVLPDQIVRLVISPPWLTRLLRVLMLALLVLTAANLARRLFGGVSLPLMRSSAASAAVLFALLLSTAATPSARAGDIPDANLLNELRNRLLEAPKCVPQCASASRAEVRVAGDSVRVVLDIAAGERVAIPLPSADAALVLDGARLDGSAVDGVARDEESLWLPVGRGVHRIDLDFRSIDTDHLALKFPLQPERITVSLDGWQSGGVSEQRLLGDTLTLTRERRESNAATPGRPVAQQFPPFVRVERNLLLDLEWSVNAAAYRLAPEEGGFATRVDLLGNEQVLSAGTKQEEGKVLLSFGADQDQLNWNSRLERADTITLTAPPLAERAEVWRVTSSEMWHAEFSGVPEVASADGGTHEFHRLPGETLTIKVTRPEAVEGKSFAIDAVNVTSSAGSRALDTTLTFSLRSTQGGEHVVTLPNGAEVLGLSKNGQVLNLRPRDGKLSLPLTPGAQRFEIRLRQAQELGTVANVPVFNLGAAAANVSLDLNLPGDRWVLFAFGPPVGPAVLYWGELVVMILVAWALSRMRRTPLKLWHWLLLGFGFSAFSWGLLLVVVAWLFALDWRERWPAPKNDGIFNLAQIGLAILTVAALLCLIASIPFGLLGQPNMHITGNGSSAQQLKWFADQVAETLPSASAVSLPMWAYKLTMLAWALWLANALISWLRWGFAAWTKGGYWKSSPKKPKEPSPPPAQPADSEPKA